MTATRAVITEMDVRDVRFPTSEHLDGSDAMNPDPDYSAAYVVLRTNAPDGLEGHALAFTIGTGNDVQARAIEALNDHVLGLEVNEMCADLGGFSRRLVYDPPLRWLGPEKGVMHMAIGAVINAAWDLAAKRAGQPVWQFLADMSPEDLVRMVDYRYLTDALTPEESLEILRRAEPGRTERAAVLVSSGYPAYTTSPGWLGYSDAKLQRLAEEDVHRMGLVRAVVGPDIRIAVDANQRWDVVAAVEWMRRLAPYDPYWIEEPTSPDDILGHARIRREISPIKVATGEHVANRVVFKQLLQAEAVDIVQIDAARVGGINENIAILLLAAKFGVPVCPHAGGVGLCEMVQHLAMFDFVAVSGTTHDRVLEYVDHLHEHFVDPVRMRQGHYQAPSAPGLSAEMHPKALNEYAYPNGPVWTERGA